jgi:hypothetical protein
LSGKTVRDLAAFVLERSPDAVDTKAEASKVMMRKFTN